MHTQLVFMYSGQGSQFYHMGRELYNNNLCFRKCMLKLDDIAYGINGKSIIDHIYDDTKKKSDLLDKITYSHPAIFMVEYSLTQLLAENGIYPDNLLGASLGEYVCAAVANIVSVEKVLEMVIKQAEMIEDLCPEGSMIAILEDTDLFNADFYISERSELAGINFPRHFVISGLKKNLADIEIYLRKKNILYQFLPVSYGFHSDSINHVKIKYLDYLQRINYSNPDYTIFSCSLANQVTDITAHYFWEIIRKPIMFQQTIIDIENSGNYSYLDLSPSGTLSTFIKYNFTTLKSHSSFILNPFGNDIKQLNFVLDSL